MGARESRKSRPSLSSLLQFEAMTTPFNPISTMLAPITGAAASATGGYVVTFVQQPLEERYKCPVCLLALRDPVQTSCGHRICSQCLMQ